jgi:hypothetical protein
MNHGSAGIIKILLMIKIQAHGGFLTVSNQWPETGIPVSSSMMIWSEGVMTILMLASFAIAAVLIVASWVMGLRDDAWATARRRLGARRTGDLRQLRDRGGDRHQLRDHAPPIFQARRGGAWAARWQQS